MLNTTKLLYILPDVAYVAELLAGKKPHTFSVHAFRQINGEFLQKNALIGKNILKLFSKLEEGEYTLVLPDAFFTNAIITVDETNDAKIQDYITKTTFPQLKLSDTTHHLESYVLTEFKGSSQVQIAALDKKRLAPIRAALSQTSITLAATISLSWSIKSLISLEPSASVIQMGTELYAAKQYIGIDETSSASVTDAAAVAEAIKVLKGSDANLQTVYLVSNELIQDTLKEELSSVIPIQQLASQKDDDTQMPNYIRHSIEAAGRTLSIKEYPVPRFSLDAASDADLKEFDIESLAVDSSTSSSEVEESDEATAEDTLPTPAAAPSSAELEPTPVSDASSDEEALPEIPMVGELDEDTHDDAAPDESGTFDDTEDVQSATEIAAAASSGVAMASTAVAAASTAVSPVIEELSLDVPASSTPSEKSSTSLETSTAAASDAPSASSIGQPKITLGSESEPTPEKEEVVAPESKPIVLEAPQAKKSPATEPLSEVTPKPELDSEPKKPTLSPLITPSPKTAESQVESQGIDLSKFSSHTPANNSPAGKPLAAGALASPRTTTIKNKGGVQNMFKMILITTAVFIVTVAVGVGVGLGILSLTNKGTAESPVVVETPAPTTVTTPEPVVDETPVASPAAELVKSEYDILVVNATTKAGYAGTISDELNEYGTVRSGNAKGRYTTPGMYVSLKEEVPGLLEALQADTELELVLDESALKTEDAAGTYDAVIILAE